MPVRADEAEELRLAGVIQSKASPSEKEAACGRLKQIGTIKSVPALATLLNSATSEDFDRMKHGADRAAETLNAEANEAHFLAIVEELVSTGSNAKGRRAVHA